MARKFLIEVPDNYEIEEIFGSMLNFAGKEPVTAGSIKEQLRKPLCLVPELYYAALYGEIKVEEIL